MNREQIQDALISRLNDIEIGLSDGGLLDFYVDVKEINKMTKDMLDQIKDIVMDHISETYGDEEFDYKGKKIKVVSKAGTLNYDDVVEVSELVARVKYIKQLYKNYLTQIERGTAKIKDGYLITADGEMISKDEIPYRNDPSRYIRVGYLK